MAGHRPKTPAMILAGVALVPPERVALVCPRQSYFRHCEFQILTV